MANSGVSVSLKSKYSKEHVTVLYVGPARPAEWLQQSRIWGSGTLPAQLGAAGVNKVLIQLSCYYLPAVIN